MSRSILIMAGGTGGHIFPALAVADVLRSWGWQVTWMGAPRSMEAELVPKHGYDIAWVRFSGLRGKGLMRLLALPFNLIVAIGQSAMALFRYRPDVVLGMGGYITIPGGLTAALLLKPLVIHEQNSIAGLSNKVLAKLAKRVMSGFPNVLPGADWCGNPVRNEIAALPDPVERYNARTGRLQLLVVGGSLGAQAINEMMPKALALFSEQARPEVIHQTGNKHLESVQQNYRELNVVADVRAFLENMAQQYAKADLVICRAGALTVAELAAAGVASILIPFPYAVDDHQTFNARFLSERGAALLVQQKDLDAEKLATLIADLGREKLLAMAQLARNAGKSDAARLVAMACKEVAEA